MDIGEMQRPPPEMRIFSPSLSECSISRLAVPLAGNRRAHHAGGAGADAIDSKSTCSSRSFARRNAEKFSEEASPSAMRTDPGPPTSTRASMMQCRSSRHSTLRPIASSIWCSARFRRKCVGGLLRCAAERLEPSTARRSRSRCCAMAATSGADRVITDAGVRAGASSACHSVLIPRDT